MNGSEFLQRFEAEARRLRLNMLRLPALASNDTDRQEILDRVNKLMPGVTWDAVFPGFVPPQPHPAIADLVCELDENPEKYWRQRETQDAVFRELARVAPELDKSAASSGSMAAYTYPHGWEHALRVLRRLPDGARPQVVCTALENTPPDA